ncbi:hypothetical protein J6590_074180 [Homalodisca vitripennis]|nr:hypothetical protein J6590_074180 [Homalodisca vitripennis]
MIPPETRSVYPLGTVSLQGQFNSSELRILVPPSPLATGLDDEQSSGSLKTLKVIYFLGSRKLLSLYDCVMPISGTIYRRPEVLSELLYQSVDSKNAKGTVEKVFLEEKCFPGLLQLGSKMHNKYCVLTYYTYGPFNVKTESMSSAGGMLL